MWHLWYLKLTWTMDKSKFHITLGKNPIGGHRGAHCELRHLCFTLQIFQIKMFEKIKSCYLGKEIKKNTHQKKRVPVFEDPYLSSCNWVFLTQWGMYTLHMTKQAASPGPLNSTLRWQQWYCLNCEKTWATFSFKKEGRELRWATAWAWAELQVKAAGEDNGRQRTLIHPHDSKGEVAKRPGSNLSSHIIIFFLQLFQRQSERETSSSVLSPVFRTAKA